MGIASILAGGILLADQGGNQNWYLPVCIITSVMWITCEPATTAWALSLDKTVVPGWHTLRYRGCGSDAKEMYFKPDYYPEGLFQPGITHKITVIKKDRDIFIRVQNPEQTYYCHMTNPDLPIVTEGRIGLRHMFTRSARYKN